MHYIVANQPAGWERWQRRQKRIVTSLTASHGSDICSSGCDPVLGRICSCSAEAPCHRRRMHMSCRTGQPSSVRHPFSSDRLPRSFPCRVRCHARSPRRENVLYEPRRFLVLSGNVGNRPSANLPRCRHWSVQNVPPHLLETVLNRDALQALALRYHGLVRKTG